MKEKFKISLAFFLSPLSFLLQFENIGGSIIRNNKYLTLVVVFYKKRKLKVKNLDTLKVVHIAD